MSKELEIIQEIFQDLLDDEELEITEETSMDNLEEWDSLVHINLVAAVEDEFGIKLSAEDIAGIHSVADILSVIDK